MRPGQRNQTAADDENYQNQTDCKEFYRRRRAALNLERLSGRPEAVSAAKAFGGHVAEMIEGLQLCAALGAVEVNHFKPP